VINFSIILAECSAATRKYAIVGQKYFKGANERLGKRQKYTKYKIHNSENFRGAILLPGRFQPHGPAYLRGWQDR